MSDIKRYYDKRFLINYDVAMDESYCVLWAIPIGLAKVMVGLLQERGSWRTTYVKEYKESYYISPSMAEFSILEDMIGSFLGGVSMSNCLDGLLEVLGQIRDAMRASAQCCLSSTNGWNMVDLGEGDYAFGTEQPLTEPEEGEFEDEEAYKAHRCAAANSIIAEVVSGFNQFGIVSLATIVGGGLVLAVVATPPVGIFYAMAAAGFLFAACELISNYMDDHRQELVCMLYNAETYAEWQIAITDWVENMTIEIEVVGFNVDISNLIRSMVSTDVWNKFYSALYFPTPENGVSCDECAPECSFAQVVAYGTVVGENTFQSTDRGDGLQTIVVRFWWSGGEYGDTCQDLTEVDFDIVSSPGDVLFRLFDTTGTQYYDSTTIPVSESPFEAYITCTSGQFSIAVADLG